MFSCHYKPAYNPAYKSWYNIFFSQQISRTNQHKRLYEQPNRAREVRRVTRQPREAGVRPRGVGAVQARGPTQRDRRGAGQGASYKVTLLDKPSLVVKWFKEMNGVGREDFLEHMWRLGGGSHPPKHLPLQGGGEVARHGLYGERRHGSCSISR